MSTADGDVPVLGFRATRDLEPGETILCVRVRVRVRVRAMAAWRACNTETELSKVYGVCLACRIFYI